MSITSINKNSNNNNSSNQSNIFVAVRVRPETEAEIAGNSGRTVVRVMDNNVITLDTVSPPSALNRRPDREQRFIFDRVFDQFATQKEVYENTTRDVITSIMNGYNATVFAYGATGAGKTHTMIGNERSGPGVMVLTMRDLFEALDKQASGTKKYKISMSYMEIYNETIHDLFVPESKSLGLREDAKGQVVVADLTERFPTSADEVFKWLEMGNANRKQSPTMVNQQSSRSHAILQVYIRHQESLANGGGVNCGKLSLIDLAGSERAARTLNRGVRLVEGANINKSLLSLGNCINALCGRPGAYVPYRDSKLTRLLKDSLGGNCKTVMIANISPNSTSYEESHNTLLYANRAKEIKTRVEKNVLNVNTHLSQYTEIIKELREEVRGLKQRLADASNNGTIADKDDDEVSEDGDTGQLNIIVDEINTNLQETLRLKKAQSLYEDQTEGCKAAMERSRAIIHAYMEDESKAEMVRELREEYQSNRQELQTLEAKKGEIEMDLNSKDTWRKKLQLELPSNVKSQKDQNYLIQQARAAGLELDRWDISDKFIKQNKYQNERLAELTLLDQQHRGSIETIYQCLTQSWKIINGCLPAAEIPVEFVNEFLVCSELWKESHQSPSTKPKKTTTIKLPHESMGTESNKMGPKSILKKTMPVTPGGSTTSTSTTTTTTTTTNSNSKKRVLEQDDGASLVVMTPRSKKLATTSSAMKPGSRTIMEAIVNPTSDAGMGNGAAGLSNGSVLLKPIRVKTTTTSSSSSSSSSSSLLASTNQPVQSKPLRVINPNGINNNSNNNPSATATSTATTATTVAPNQPKSLFKSATTLSTIKRVKVQPSMDDGEEKENSPKPPPLSSSTIANGKSTGTAAIKRAAPPTTSSSSSTVVKKISPTLATSKKVSRSS
ncbi:hypothetical protein SAMD00019534_078540 [Acytostelium subglobosum LB1]|uniref:hypothetical protein n=1 Tax=Acytostelium subglobosum LB1 TaxID=1410327 RepID=UPI000644FAD2|nr:hypothetical protein SAMD00019534_078540 [Acytostelium subglobosum LB1]GAM24679.1 hypothetical protein SAMD00019534_078540 [Acytostelium subglobosum LB1]|eukprot:XP_012752348.1 hypothetical protein SAMD00019534_078540 [Acytostelium subglobosum LB1]